jgi:predicted glutamine amidotransferase
MCRMIAAVGRFDAAAVRRALVRMAANDNPAHDHERRSLGQSFRHTDGWGAAWIQEGQLRTLRRTNSVLADDWVEQLDALQSGLLLLHARRATKSGTTLIENTHPFPATFLGRDWAFCHNGSVDDLEGLQTAPGMSPAGTTDSERLFHHFLAELAARSRGGHVSLDTETIETALTATAAVPHNFTAVHCLVASGDRALAVTRRHPERGEPEYHALWLGEGPGLRTVSSEPVDGLECDWTRLPEPGIVTLEVP